MSKPARTIYVWSFYVLVVGAILAVAPNFLLKILSVAETDEVWIRVLGLVVALLALYYWDAARNESRNFFVATVLGRSFVAAGLLVLAVTSGPWQLLLFGAVDLAGAIWTLSALRSEAA